MSRSPRITSLFYSLAALLWFTKPAFAQIPNQTPVGTRPLSMGEAFVAVADDGHAIHWNPAGLANLERIQLNFSRADLFGLGITNTYASFLSRFYFIPPLADYLSFGAAWSGIHTKEEGDGQEIGYGQDQVYLALAFKPPKSWLALRHLSVGANVKYLQLGGKYDGVTAGNAKGWGGDFGLLYDFGALLSGQKKNQATPDTTASDTSAAKRKDDHPQQKTTKGRRATNRRSPVHSVLQVLTSVPQNLQVGLMMHDIGDTEIKHRTGVREPVQFQKARLGFSYRPPEEWFKGFFFSDPVLALDFDDRMHLGLEFLLMRFFAVRAGWQRPRHQDENDVFSFGMGLKLSVRGGLVMSADFTRTDSPLLPAEAQPLGLSLILKNNPRLIRIEDAYVKEDVFVSLSPHYAAAGGEFIEAQIRNVYQQPIAVEVKLAFDQYTKYPKSKTVTIPPDSTVRVPVPVVFDPKILQITSDGELRTASIEAEYSTPQHGFHRVTKNVDFKLHGRGYLTWEDHRRATAFITRNDNCLVEFAQKVVQQDSALAPKTFFTRNMLYALRLYEALRLLKYNYVGDPRSTFASIVGKKHAVDHIKYPAEFLASESRSGDCDDLAVLYASLLETVGVEVALLVTSNHVFVMLNTDIPARNLNSMPVNRNLFVSHRDRLWMSIETTALPLSFLEAWRKGAAEYRDHSAAIVEQDGRYPPVSLPFAAACAVQAPMIKDSVFANLGVLKDMVAAYLKKYDRELSKNSENLELRNSYAVILGQNGQRSLARAHLDTVLKKDSTYAAAANNLGNLEFIAGHFPEAERQYQRAKRFDGDHKINVYLNLAYLYALQMTTDSTNKETHEAKWMQNLVEARQWLAANPHQALSVRGLYDLVNQQTGVKGEETGKKQDQPIAQPVTTKKDSSNVSAPPFNESDLSKQNRSFGQLIITILRAILEGPEPETPNAGAGSKGKDQFDEDRARLLWWSV